MSALRTLKMDVAVDENTTVTAPMQRLDIDLPPVGQVVIWHPQFDHAGGLVEMLSANVIL